MSRLDTMARFEEHPALPEPPFFDFEDLEEHVRRPRREHCVADTPEQIRRCLSCVKPECTDCLSRPSKPRSKRKRRSRRKKKQVSVLDGQARDA
jgi:hypothetical protein